MGYAMACVEVVDNWSPHGGDLYRQLVGAWAALTVKAFYDLLIADVCPAKRLKSRKRSCAIPD